MTGRGTRWPCLPSGEGQATTVTRDDVARRAGVSPAVVSYVLNDGPRPVAAATRERVRKAVEELGYRPDGRARALRRGRSDTIGLVVPDITNPFFGELVRAVQEEAGRQGCALLVGNAGEGDDEQSAYMLELAERRVDGLLAVAALSADALGPILALGIPVVVLDRAGESLPVATVRIDNHAAAEEAVRHLMAHGRHSICLINGPESSGVSQARRAGWERAVGNDGRGVIAPYSAAGGERAMAELLAGGRVEAVLIASDIQAIGAQRRLADCGLDCPHDVAMISVDGTEAGRYAPVPLTSVVQPVQDIAAVAVEQVLRSSAGADHVTLHHSLLIRRSCGCPPAPLPGRGPAAALHPGFDLTKEV